MTNEQVLKIFEDSGALWKGHFLLTSGRHSDRYMQCANLFTDPVSTEKLCAGLAAKLKGTHIDLVASPAVGGIIMGYCLARRLKVKNIFAERNSEGKMEFRRGFAVKPGQKVLIAENVVTTGGSVREVADLVKAAGGEVVAVAAAVDRSAGKVDFGCPLYPALSLDVPSWDAADCPLCKAGVPVVKPGSRK